MNAKTLRYEKVAVGDKLPELKIDITTSLIVSTAIASRDFTEVHHDKKAAQDCGLPDVFMNILTSNGFMGRFVTDWAGPDSTLKSIDLRLGAPNVPGVVMTVTGEVKSKDDAAGTVDVEVVGENNVWGKHMSGTVRVALPKEA
ncbi:MaoC/PaaZ C-terminal domain-containing protein [Denitratisoma oestradiolicum]|uniref:Putative MaoC like domain protein n=1 Tax=Denitratisoma oestradiolicum TaxID=311182 RepID=A0A6S6XW88_9PROT|nr:MaoC/PaaZ C-terminal domain-containing protein [Denitratisoma oestradiolicum]TWO81316.1 acyl dehydratase [Denitratisoma oestradiolicum]CAB1368503.1 putative MaoC like domain protein [Denitratisoma oestradiolicum]